ncbi:amino acid permease 3-like [Miscanthus floridulus]|uniref:amino acid permease 3-like n=1 Tax=Miscanthus floridulus TaxID=154761 RepID=UPI00345A1831
MDAVRSILCGPKVAFYGAIQYANLAGVAIGYSISMQAISRAGCFHKRGHGDQIWWFSILAAVVTSFTYSSIGLSLGIAQTICKLLILQPDLL